MNKIKLFNYIKGIVKLSFHKVLFFSIISIAFCIALDNWGDMHFIWDGFSNVTVYYYIWNSLTFGGVYLPFLALAISTIVGTTGYCKEYNGVDKYLIYRLGDIKKYALSKIVYSFISSNFIYISGICLFVGITSIFRPFYDKTLDIEAAPFPYFDLLHVGKGILYMVPIIIISGLRVTIWNSVALVVSAYTHNIQATIATPMIASYIIVRCMVICSVPDRFRIDFFMNGRGTVGSDMGTIFVCGIFTAIIAGICWRIFIKKVVSDHE